MSLNKNIRLIQVYTVLTNAGFVIPVIMPYYRDQMGLDFQEFLLGEACFAATVVLLEVPTGWISDVWKRKHTLALGAFFELLGYACLVIGDSLAWAIAAQCIIGVGISLISGTNVAFIYDTLLSAGKEKDYRRQEGKRSAIAFYTIAGASVIGGLAYPLHHQLPALLTVLTITAALAIACLMDEPERHKRRPEKHPLADMIETARYALHGHAEIGLIILFAAIMFCSTKLIMWSQQPYYMAMGLEESLFGILMAAGFLLAGISSHLGHRLDGRVGSVKTLMAVWLVAMLVCIGASLHLGWSGVALLMLGGSCLYGIAGPRVSEAINSRVGSERRATILSTQHLMVSLLFIPVSGVLGWVSDGHGVTGTLLGIACWLGLAGLCLTGVLLRRKNHRRMMML